MNIFGLERHPTDDWVCYCHADKDDLLEARQLYEDALKGNADSLQQLVRWARHNAETDKEYDMQMAELY